MAKDKLTMKPSKGVKLKVAPSEKSTDKNAKQQPPTAKMARGSVPQAPQEYPDLPVFTANGGQLIVFKPILPGDERRATIHLDQLLGVETATFYTISRGKRNSILADLYKPTGFAYSSGDRKATGTRISFLTGGSSIVNASKADVMAAIVRGYDFREQTIKNKAIALQACRTKYLDNFEKIDPDVRCRHCEGYGQWVKATGTAIEMAAEYAEEPCPTCKGSGLDPDAKKIKAAKKKERQKIIKLEKTIKKAKKKAGGKQAVKGK